MKKYTLPMLYAYASDGKRIKEWQVSAVPKKDGTAEIVRCHGFQGLKKQTFVLPIKEGKNLGKRNETTPFEQAVSEARSLWNSKIDEGYAEELVKHTAIDKPMLAKPIEDGRNAVFPADLQPKLNGIRCIVHRISKKEFRFVSRKGKEYITLAHLIPDLEHIMTVGMVLDGELFTEGISLNKISQLVKKYRPGETEKIQYWIYDMPSWDGPWETRTDAMRRLGVDNTNNIIFTPTIRVINAEEAWSIVDAWIDEGFEGGILRNLDGEYEPKRSNNLLKMKKFLDEEFEIIGGKEGKGRDKGCVIFQCVTNTGKDFWVRPMGSVEDRQRWMKDLPKIIGKELTVKFLEWSDYGIPQGNTVGVVIRDYE
jgi:DNA ligase-1